MEAIKGFIEVTCKTYNEKELIPLHDIGCIRQPNCIFKKTIYLNGQNIIHTKESYEEIKQLIINAQK